MKDSGNTQFASPDAIRELHVTRFPGGQIKDLRVAFGPHHFLHLDTRDGRVFFTLGVTHHGMTFDASDVNGELERAMDALKSVCRPENVL